jgi:hypothetical protein
MPFGLTNAPASFQKLANAVFAGLKGVNLQVFIDDVCVAKYTWEEHLASLHQVFLAVERANLTLKAEKCIFGASKIIFLGHEISQEGIRQDPNKLQGVPEKRRTGFRTRDPAARSLAFNRTHCFRDRLPEHLNIFFLFVGHPVSSIAKLSPPKDREGVRRFLGMSGYYRKFVPGFSIIAGPLIELTRQKTQFRWGEKEQKSFQGVKDALLKNATLAHFNHYDPLMLKTDACHEGIAGILLQQQNG